MIFKYVEGVDSSCGCAEGRNQFSFYEQSVEGRVFTSNIKTQSICIKNTTPDSFLISYCYIQLTSVKQLYPYYVGQTILLAII